uniref:DUF4371 domain-containing protein n=1 Tax=Timema genevievae TaxID=629358 RepID=A0A7R9JZX9_TIMGE|nr:unnamed protein product [Timema genevievae]
MREVKCNRNQCNFGKNGTSDAVTINERLLGFTGFAETTGENLHSIIKGFLVKIVAYDGASNMSGKFNGVRAIFKEEEPIALYTHFHAHLLDLAVMRFCE